jgi:hypothetical protein
MKLGWVQQLPSWTLEEEGRRLSEMTFMGLDLGATHSDAIRKKMIAAAPRQWSHELYMPSSSTTEPRSQDSG